MKPKPRGHDLVVVIDFGAQYAQLIARRVREAQGLLRDHAAHRARRRDRRAAARRRSSCPVDRSRCTRPGAPQVDPALFDAGVPTFGICYGFQAMARALGGDVARTGLSEFGRTEATITDPGHAARRTAEQPAGLDEPRRLGGRGPGRLHRAGQQRRCPDRRLRGRRPRASPACSGTPRCCTPRPASGCWRTSCSTSPAAARTGRRPTSSTTRSSAIRAQVGDKHLICGLSGGVDSAVAAALVQRAVGSQLTCVFVDHGLLRQGEAEQVERDFVAATGVDLKVVDAADQFLDALAGVTEPETKRKIIGREFIRTFEAAAREVVGEAGDGRVPGPGHPLSRRGRVRRRRGRGQHQEPPQRRRAAGRPEVPAGRAAAHPVQGRGARGRGAARAAGRDRLAAPVPRPGLAIRIIGEVTRDRLRCSARRTPSPGPS